MPVVTTYAVILQTFKYSDTSKILRLITRSNGLQSVIAKGALRPKSPFGGVLEPFTEGTASFHAKENRDLHTLSSFELSRSRQRLGSDLIRFGGASLVAELVLRSGIEEPDPDLFDAVRAALDRIQDAPSAQVESVVLGEHVVLERTAAHWRLLARFLAHHVLDGTTLKSLTFLAETLQEPE